MSGPPNALLHKRKRYPLYLFLTSPPSASVLNQMVDLLHTIMKHNVISSLLVVGGVIVACHYRLLIERFGGFPVLLACGPSETGKSITLHWSLPNWGPPNILLCKGY